MHTDYSVYILEKSKANLKHNYKNKINQINSAKWRYLGNPSHYVEVTIVKAKFLPERLHEKHAMGLVERRYSCVTIEELLKDRRGKVILLEGDPGAGKTTFTFKICKEWANDELDMLKENIVLWIPLCRYTSITTINELFKKFDYPECMSYAQQNSGKGLVLILDGWDEVCDHQQVPSFFHDIIFGKFKEFTQSTIIVTSRPTDNSHKIAEEIQQTDSYYKILGFDKRKAMTYIDGYFQNDPPSAEFLHTYLNIHENLCQHFYIPISVAIMCFVCCFNDKWIPPTLSRLYEHSVLLCLRFNVCDTSPQDLPEFKTIHDVPEKVQPVFHKLCKIAFVL